MSETKKTLLAIDDEISILEILNYFLGKKYQVVTHKNGKDALTWMHKGEVPEVIIADFDMPEMNGYDFIHHVRSSGLFKDIPLIMLSGNENSVNKVKCLRAGADDYMIKPFNPEELDARIESILRRIKK